VIEDDFEEHVIDGVRIVFQNTPGTEAPAEMNAWFPQQKVFWAAENITATVHNVYTLRGALVRDALQWSKQINEALYRYGREAEVMVSSHNWPRWGNDRIQQVMRAQRDAYANTYEATYMPELRTSQEYPANALIADLICYPRLLCAASESVADAPDDLRDQDDPKDWKQTLNDESCPNEKESDDYG